MHWPQPGTSIRPTCSANSSCRRRPPRWWRRSTESSSGSARARPSGAGSRPGCATERCRRRTRTLWLVTETISFARGAPSLDIVDVDGLREAAERAFSADPAGVTAYGTAVGYPPLREWVADRHGVEPDQVMVTNGSMQADA